MSFSVVHPCPKINHPQNARENMFFFFCVAIPKWKVYCWAYHISLAFESCKEKTVFGNVSYLGGKTHGSLEQHHVKRCFFWSVMFAKLVPMFWLTWWFECIFGSFEFWVFHCVITLNLCIIQAYTCVCVCVRVCASLFACMFVCLLVLCCPDILTCFCVCVRVRVCLCVQNSRR
jgi:hypothetical protein